MINLNNLITYELVIKLNKKILFEYNQGNNHKILKLNELISSIESPKQTMFGKNLYNSIEEIISVTSFNIIKNHPFMDGNKRTSLMIFQLNCTYYNKIIDYNGLYETLIEIGTKCNDKLILLKHIKE